MKNSNNGFSLMELMVVVAIIAILSTIAVPGYKTYQAKARQKEGMGLLSTYFSVAHAVKAEFGRFPGNFVQTGFQPVGLLGYRFEVGDGPDIPITHNDNLCINTAAACDCTSSGGNCPSFRTWSEPPAAQLGVVGLRVGPIACNAGTGCGPAVTTATTFTALTCGVISTASARQDQYSIDEGKNIVACLDGLK